MKMRDGNDDDVILRCLIDETIRKSIHLATANASRQRMPGFRKVLDTLKCLPDIIAKIFAEAYALRIVVPYCLPQLAVSGAQEPYFQTCLPSSAKTCPASTAASSPDR